MMFWYGGHWPFWEVGLMWVGMIAFWVLIGWAVYAYSKTVMWGEFNKPSGQSTAELLGERLARGDIDVEEYRNLKAELTEKSAVDTRT